MKTSSVSRLILVAIAGAAFVLGIYMIPSSTKPSSEQPGQKDTVVTPQYDKDKPTPVVDQKDAEGGADQLDPNFVVPEFVLENEDVVEEFDVKVIAGNADSELSQIYSVLAENVQKRLQTKAPVDNVLPNEGKERNITIQVVDSESGEGVSGVSVSLRGGFLGTTNPAGELTRSRKLPRTHDYLYFQANKVGYTQAFVKKSLFFTEGSDVFIGMQMKKTPKSVVSVSANKINDEVTIVEERLAVTFMDTCALTTALGECFEGESMMEYQFIAPEDLDLVSIPMRAMVDGGVQGLESNGMAFINFYSDQGELLKYSGEAATVCYTIDQAQIDAWQSSAREGDKDGYRYFDKSDGLRKLDEQAEITITDGQFCAKTKHVY